MVKVMDAVKSRKCTVKQAAENYKVPSSDSSFFLLRYSDGPGLLPWMTFPEIQSSKVVLAQFVAEVSEIGYGKTRKQIKGMVEKVASEKGLLKKKQISDGWFRRFLQRQPQLPLHKGDRTTMVRLDAMKDREALENYFSLLKCTLADNDLMDKSSQIYNAGVPLGRQSPYVLTKKGQKRSGMFHLETRHK